MPKSNPRASAIQAALQGFSSIYFPTAVDQLRAKQEIDIKTAVEVDEQANRESLEQTKFGYDKQLQEEKYRLEKEQAKAKTKPSLSKAALSKNYSVPEADISDELLLLEEDAQRQHMEAGSKARSRASADKARIVLGEARQEALKLDQERLELSKIGDVTAMRAKLAKMKEKRAALADAFVSIGGYASQVGIPNESVFMPDDFKLAQGYDKSIADTERDIAAIESGKNASQKPSQPGAAPGGSLKDKFKKATGK